MTNLEGACCFADARSAPDGCGPMLNPEAIADRLGAGSILPRIRAPRLTSSVAHAGGSADYAGITYDRMCARTAYSGRARARPSGSPRLFQERLRRDGRAKFHP